MIRRPPRSTLFPYTTALPICLENEDAVFWLQPRGASGLRRTAGRGHPVLKLTASLSLGALITFGSAESDRKSTRLNSSHANISYAVFCLKKKKIRIITNQHEH